MMNLTGSHDTANERWPLGNLGGNAGKFSSHWGWRAYFFTVLHLNALANLGGTASRRLAPMGLAFIFLENRYKYF